MAILQDSHDPSTSDGPSNDNIFEQNTFGGVYYFGQTFTTNSAYDVTEINVRLGRFIYNPNATITMGIYAVDGDSKPTGSALTTATKSIKGLPDLNAFAAHFGANPWSTFSFTPYALSASTEYAIVLSCDLASLVGWTGTTSGETGIALYSSNSGSTWSTSTTWDFAFQTYSNYALQDSFSTGSETGIALGGAYWGGQSFTPSATYVVKSIGVRLKKTGTTGTSLILSVRDTATGTPSGADRTIGTIAGSDVASGAFAWYTINLDTPYKLTASTQYCFIIRDPDGTYESFQLGMEATNNNYAGGTKLYSTDSGSSWSAVGGETDDVWFRIYGIATSGYVTPLTDAPTTKRLVAIAGNQLWYEDSNGDMIVLSASTDDIDCSEPLDMVEAFGKIFIANNTNLKVADFVNVKIATSNVGTYIPDFGNVLTGSTSSASMVVDYIDASSGAVTVYGRRITANPFEASEVVTGTDDDSNSISFTLTSAGETLPPHWYDWTVYSGDATTYGTIPATAKLVSKYNGRLVLAGNEQYPHEWWMSRVFNPWDFLYTANDTATAVTSGSTSAGEIGDVITALVDYGDDFFVFGCQSSVYLLDGDPTYRGTIERLTETEGIYGAKAWCKDHQSNLYFFSGDGLYKAEGGRRKPISLSALVLPRWSIDWDLNPDNYRLVLTFDPIRNGIIISNTSLSNGSNINYWYDIKTSGFYPESYPDSNGIYSSYYYNSFDAVHSGLLLGCYDGYIRSFYDNQKDDVITDDSDVGIQSWFVTPIIPMNEDLDREGKLLTLTFVQAGGASNGIFADPDGFDYEIFVASDAETLLESIKDDDAEFMSGTITTLGRSNQIRPRARGRYMAIRISNLNDSETFIINKIYGTVKPIRRMR